jgi:hypothetical protein
MQPVSYLKDEEVFKGREVSNSEKRSLFTDLSLSELAFYFVMFYTVFGIPLGLVVGSVGTGILMIVVLAMWFVEAGTDFFSVMRQVYLAMGCGLAYISIQMLVHNESPSEPYFRAFGVWLPSLIVVQWLVGRQQFLHRFASVSVLLGLGMIPFMNMFSTGAYGRVGLERGVGFANPNDLGYWFGFCALYLTMVGFTARKASVRLSYWFLALVCCYLMTLTVSRAPVLAMAGALLVGLRGLLKEGILLLLGLLGLVYGAFELGVFDTALHSYGLRSGEETGRLRVWPILVDRFLGSPLVGVGASHAGTFVRGDDYITPHNGLLLIAVASGVLPAALFIGHWIKAIKATIYTTANHLADSVFHLPLLTYAFMCAMTSNLGFMAPWAMVCMALPLSRLGVRHDRSYRTFPSP